VSVHVEVLLFRCEHCGVILAPQVKEVADLDHDTFFCSLCMRHRSFDRIHAQPYHNDRIQLTIEVKSNG